MYLFLSFGAEHSLRGCRSLIAPNQRGHKVNLMGYSQQTKPHCSHSSLPFCDWLWQKALMVCVKALNGICLPTPAK